MEIATRTDSLWSLRFDLMSANVLVWIARIGRDPELLPETHLYFFDRYSRLAQVYSRRGSQARAQALRERAAEHYRAGGGDGPPYAAAMGMPRPRQWVMTDARSDRAVRPPDDAA
jgi:hypothetical protein